MNEKFFDLKKEKQDRMIDAAQKAFGIHGFAHASTDDIVKDARISKGLLFHYFGSKVGLYTFLYDYSVRLFKLELEVRTGSGETDYFELYKEILAARAATMQQYPYLQAFLLKAGNESVAGADEEVQERKESLQRSIRAIMRKADMTQFVEGVDYDRLLSMLGITIDSLLVAEPGMSPIRADQFYSEATKYTNELEKILKK